MTVKVKDKQPLYFLFLNNKYKSNIFNYCLKIFYSYCLRKENIVYMF